MPFCFAHDLLTCLRWTSWALWHQHPTLQYQLLILRHLLLLKNIQSLELPDSKPELVTGWVETKESSHWWTPNIELVCQYSSLCPNYSVWHLKASPAMSAPPDRELQCGWACVNLAYNFCRKTPSQLITSCRFVDNYVILFVEEEERKMFVISPIAGHHIQIWAAFLPARSLTDATLTTWKLPAVVIYCIGQVQYCWIAWVQLQGSAMHIFILKNRGSRKGN